MLNGKICEECGRVIEPCEETYPIDNLEVCIDCYYDYTDDCLEAEDYIFLFDE